MATSHTRDVDLPYPYPVVVDAIVHAAPSVKLKVSTVDPARGMVFGSRGMSFFSYGLNVTIQLGQTTPTAPRKLIARPVIVLRRSGMTEKLTNMLSQSRIRRRIV